MRIVCFSTFLRVLAVTPWFIGTSVTVLSGNNPAFLRNNGENLPVSPSVLGILPLFGCFSPISHRGAESNSSERESHHPTGFTGG